MGLPKSRPKLQLVATATGVGALLWLAALFPVRADGVVRGFYFYSDECGHCQTVAAEVLPQLQARFGLRLELRMFDVRAPRNNEVLEALEARYGLKEIGLPELFIGGDALVGEEAMRTQAAALVEKHLAAGGADFPTQDVPVPVGGPTAVSAPVGAPLIHMAYFLKPGCGSCERTSYDLGYLQSRYPGLRVTRFDMGDEESAIAYEALAERAGVPVEQRLVAPAVFVGRDALVGGQVTRAALEALVQRYQTTGAEPVWQGMLGGVGSAQRDQALQRILERFHSFGPLAVVGAGLVDGLNPCAFATIVFFVSYLAFIGRSRREMMLVGGAFTLGVFAAYLLVGLGVLHFAQALSGYRIAGRVVYGLMGALCLAFAGVSVHDARVARSGKAEAMRLRLPRALQRRVHRVVRENSSRSAFVAVAGVTGLIVSLLELACTGQVYLPTILFVQRQPALRLHAIPYLVLYNLVFVLPLIVVFVVAALGVSSGRLAGLVQKHTGTVKLLTAGVFALLGIYLLSVAV